MNKGTSILILVANTPNAMCQNEFQLSVNNLRGEVDDVVDLPLATRFVGSFGTSTVGGSSDGRESSVGVDGAVSVWSISKRGSI